MAATPNRILIVTHGFPPLDRGSTVRVTCFTKYLPHFGWIPSVLTVKQHIAVSRGERSFDLPPDFPDAVRIIRTDVAKSAAKPSTETAASDAPRTPPQPSLVQSLAGRFKKAIEYLVAFPDTLLWWYPNAMAAGLKEIAEGDCQIILATAPPFTNFIVAWRLAKKSGLPLVLDFRDEWSTNPLFMDQFIFYKRWLARRIEKRMIALAELVITPTVPSTRNLGRNAGADSQSKFLTIPNGFDPATIPTDTSHAAAKDKVVLAHTGTLSPARNPVPFFTAIQEVMAEKPELRDKVEIVFIGAIDPIWDEAFAHWSKLFPIVVKNSLPANELLQWFADEVTVGLIFQGSGDGGKRAIPGKLYEYFALGKVVLCMDDPDGATSQMLTAMGLDLLAPLNDPKAIAAQLKRFLAEASEYQAKYTLPPNVLGKFDRKQQAGELASALDRIGKQR